MKFATQYTLKEEREGNFSTYNDEPTMTQQGDAEGTNINVIMAKYTKTGQMPQLIAQPLFGDFTDMPDYRQAIERIRDAEDAFLQVPAKVRARFGNDPGEFIKFASNPDNKAELIQMGLTKPTPAPTIDEQTLNAIRELKPKEPDNGTGQK